MTEEIAIFGVGGQGRECLDIAEAMMAEGHDLRVVGFFDDAPSPHNVTLIESRGYDVLGGCADAFASGLSLCLGIGDGRLRAALDMYLIAADLPSPVLVHPQCTIGTRVSLSPGVVIFAGARLTTNISLGRHVHVNQNATVGHDCELEAYATVNPQACISGAVRVEPEATIGAGAVVLQGLTVGSGTIVGAAACVTRSTPRCAVMTGVPARERVRSTTAVGRRR